MVVRRRARRVLKKGTRRTRGTLRKDAVGFLRTLRKKRPMVGRKTKFEVRG